MRRAKHVSVTRFRRTRRSAAGARISRTVIFVTPGLTVIARNYRPSSGDSEVDIVARDGDTVVFVEVKSRNSAEFGSPDRAIDPEKQKRITRAARSYATRAGIAWNQVRFDVVSIVFTNPPSIVHQQDAFFEGRAI